MCKTIQFPNWTLNYQVAAFGAYATILVGAIYLILGRFENASLLSISILTNASALLVTGFSGTSSTPFAVTRICLTSLLLLWALIASENETFDGTYAILCSLAHFFYQFRLWNKGGDSEGFLPPHDIYAKIGEAPSESCLRNPPTDSNNGASFSRSLRIFFGDSFCFEGTMVPVTILGTVMVYRIFDFNPGFGLVFAFMSASFSSTTLFFINYARMRGRRMETRKELLILFSLMLAIGNFFVFSTIMDAPVLDLFSRWSEWSITFGVAWFVHPPKSTL